MTDSKWKPHKSEVGAKSTVRFKEGPPAHQTKLHSLKAKGKKRRDAGVEKWGRMKRKTSHSPPSVILADKRTNCIDASWHPRVRMESHSVLSCMWTCRYAPGSIGSHTGATAVHSSTSQPFILPSFVFCYTCVCCLSSLFDRIDCYYYKQHYYFFVLKPQVSGLCTPQEPGLDGAANNIPR